MKNKLRTRNAQTGREPRTRDLILDILKNSPHGWTMKEIAETIGVSQNTPYRALQTLKRMNLVQTASSIDGTIYYVNENGYDKLEKIAKEDDRYISLD